MKRNQENLSESRGVLPHADHKRYVGIICENLIQNPTKGLTSPATCTPEDERKDHQPYMNVYVRVPGSGETDVNQL